MIVKSVIWAPISVISNGSEHFLEVYGLFVLPLLWNIFFSLLPIFMFDCILHTSTNPIIGVNFINSSSHFAAYVLDFLTVHGMKRSSWADRMNQLFLLQYALPVGSMINSSLSWGHKDILKFHNFAYFIDV